MKVLGFQLEVEEKTEGFREYIDEEKVLEQYQNAIKHIEHYQPDIVIYPEMGFLSSFEEMFKTLSANRIIIGGSYYDENNVNTTVVFQNELVTRIPKIYPSPHEPYFLTNNLNEEPTEIVKRWENAIEKGETPAYFYYVEEIKKYIVILNCIDYYKLAHYVSRNPILSPHIFALISPCSNNNETVFLDETKVIHNHNPNIYSFVVNCFAKLNNESYAVGKSYVFGPIDPYSKSVLNTYSHPAYLLNVGQGKKGFFIETADHYHPFKRTDFYRRNPQRIEVFDLL